MHFKSLNHNRIIDMITLPVPLHGYKQAEFCFLTLFGPGFFTV